MKIGELFLSLGIKGNSKANRDLGMTVEKLGDIKSMSLGAKAGILAMLYGLQKITSESAKTGAGLSRFGEFTGLSTKKLQQWQHAAKLVSLENAEVEGSIKAVQATMTKMILGKGAPEGLNLLASIVDFDIKKVRDTFYVMEKLQEMAQKAPKDVGNVILQSFGITEGMIAAMRKNAFVAKQFADAPLYSDVQIKKLTSVSTEWARLSNRMRVAMGLLTADYGIPIIRDIADTSKEVVKLVASLVQLADKLKVFEVLGTIIKGWTLLFAEASGVVDVIGAKTDEKPITMENVFAGTSKPFEFNAENKIGDLIRSMIRPSIGSQAQTIVKNRDEKRRGENLTVTQTLNFQHEGKDAKLTKDSVKSAVTEAFRQYGQGQES